MSCNLCKTGGCLLSRNDEIEQTCALLEAEISKMEIDKEAVEQI